MLRPIIFFGASFNPITHAHLDIIKYLIKSTLTLNPRPIVLLAPVYSHILNKAGLADFESRLEMIKLSIEYLRQALMLEGIVVDSHDIIISRIEEETYQIKSKEPQEHSGSLVVGTFDVLTVLRKKAEEFNGDGNALSLVLGNDTYEDFLGGIWQKADQIMDLCHSIHVFDRDNASVSSPMTIVQDAIKNSSDSGERLERLHQILQKLQEPKAQKIFVFHLGAISEPHRSASSTAVRQNLEGAEKSVVSSVFEYLKQHPEIYKS